MRIRSALVPGLLGCALAACVTGCGGGFRPYPLQDPMWRDPDRRPFLDEPEEYWSPFAWDGADQMLFRPLARVFAVDPAGESLNVNSMDEVPDSSWFSNRAGLGGFSADQARRGACRVPPLDPSSVWTVTGAKPNGANPGFPVKAENGLRYMVKFDGLVQGPRATAADVVGSRLYHAAGYFAPCNRVVFFQRGVLKIDPEATTKVDGVDVPLESKHLETVLSKAVRLPDGRYRASTSLFIEGKPLGPWRYEGTREDDANDVIAHEDRRDLRGMRVLAAWTNHFDSREQNTLSAWMKTRRGGYVRHYLIDFGDCFGSIWEPPQLGRRIGHSNYFDPGDILTDWVTLGIPKRPWDGLRFGRSGSVFAYYRVDRFVPENWEPGYPNPAFLRMSELDGVWMARILAEIGESHIRAMVEAARLPDRRSSDELTRLILGRREKILRHYLRLRSPLTRPLLARRGEKVRVCLTDLVRKSGVGSVPGYWGKAYVAPELRPLRVETRKGRRARACVLLPSVVGASEEKPGYLVVDIGARREDGGREASARLHLYHLGGTDYRVVALERPEDDAPPG